MIAFAEAVTPPVEDRLLARCRCGEPAALEEVYSLHAEAVYRHAFRLLGHRDDAHDVRQETFLRAFRTLRGFRGDCPLRAWLLRICTNLCRNRARSPRREVSLDAAPETGCSPPGSGEDGLAATVRMALDLLPAGHREVIVLRDLEGLSAAETAAVLGCSPASVGVKLFRARRLLKSRVEALLA